MVICNVTDNLISKNNWHYLLKTTKTTTITLQIVYTIQTDKVTLIHKCKNLYEIQWERKKRRDIYREGTERKRKRGREHKNATITFCCNKERVEIIIKIKNIYSNTYKIWE